MRRSRVKIASLASASNAAQTLAPISHPELSPGPQLSPCLSLLRLVAVVTVLGLQFRCALSTTTTATATTTTTTIVSTQNNRTENNFYFDEQNTNKTISFIAANTADTTADISSMPVETIKTATATTATTTATTTTTTATTTTKATTRTQLGHIALPTTRPAVGSASADSDGIGFGAGIGFGFGIGLGNGTAARNLNAAAAAAAAAVELRPTGLATTTKSARSATKQPIDSTRSRNHWTSGGSVDAERSRTFRSKYHHENHYGPFFEEPSNQVDPGKTLVAAVHLFTEAVLNCRVGMLKDKTVMWVRRTTEKVSLLTVGNVTYSGDPRIRVKFQYPNNWRLMINPTQREDAGIYMCQVSTHPPRVFTTNLTILEPPLRIIDEHERDVGDRYYKSGSTVDLQCQISRNFYQKERYNILKSTELGSSLAKLNETASEINLINDANQTHATFSSQELEKYFTNFITWAKDEEPLQALTNRRSSVSDKWLNSRISIPDAKLSDSGNYSCSLGRLFTVIVQVQVLTGELPAAVQHNLARRSVGCLLLYWSLFVIVICFYMLQSHSSQLNNVKLLNA